MVIKQWYWTAMILSNDIELSIDIVKVIKQWYWTVMLNEWCAIWSIWHWAKGLKLVTRIETILVFSLICRPYA